MSMWGLTRLVVRVPAMNRWHRKCPKVLWFNTGKEHVMAMQVDRISPQEAKEHMESGALLVCGYDSDNKFRENHLNGAISVTELKARENQIARDHELIFYCA